MKKTILKTALIASMAFGVISVDAQNKAVLEDFKPSSKK
jgi:hypothetical protein